MEILSYIVLLIGVIFLIIGFRLNRRDAMWKRIADKQKALIDTQREIINTQRDTVQIYKNMLAKGITGTVGEN